MDLISIVVPVYNSEVYIERCLESLVKQTYENIEIIVINDGSKDKSSDIISKFLYDQRVVYVERENRGIGFTRNQGVELARGKYLCFVDSDDYITSNFVEKLYQKLVDMDADLVWCDYTHVFGGKTSISCQSEEDILKFEYPCLWNKMYKTSLFKENGIKFPDSWYEDLATVPRVFLLSKKSVYLNEPLYYYWQHENSITTTFSVRADDMNLVLEVLDEFFKKYKLKDIDWVQNYIVVFHGLCGTVFRMMMSKDHTSKEICTFYQKMIDKLNGRRFEIKVFKMLPLKYKLFYVSLWKWSIPLVRCGIILMKRMG